MKAARQSKGIQKQREVNIVFNSSVSIFFLDLIDSDYILVDEVSMLPKFALNIMDTKMRELKTEKGEPFGNTLLILGGLFVLGNAINFQSF